MLRALEAVGVATRPAAVVIAIFSHDFYRVIPEASGVGFPLPRYALQDGALVTVPYPTRPPWMRLALVQGARYGWFRYTAATFDLNAAILGRVRTLGREHGFTPAVVFIPGPRQRFDDRLRRAWLARWCGRAGVPFLDLTDAMDAGGGLRLYLEDDGHWNAKGHDVAAAALRPLVQRLLDGDGHA